MRVNRNCRIKAFLNVADRAYVSTPYSAKTQRGVRFSTMMKKHDTVYSLLSAQFFICPNIICAS